MNWIKKKLPKKIEIKHVFLLAFLMIASFLRLYNIPNTVQFLGDQGRDAIAVSKIFTEFNPVFIGPVTSVGNMYLGPLYYYFMLPFLILTYPSPMGPVYAMAILGILTVFLMYYIGKQFLSERAALAASGLFGLSAVVAHNTRFSWNPNPAPIVSLFLIFFTYKAIKNDTKYWILVTVCFAILIQLHYLTLLSGAGFGVVWLYQLVSKMRKNKSVKQMLLNTVFAVFIFFISLTPLLLFDLKHDGLNRKAFIEILTKEDTFSGSSENSSNSITKVMYGLKGRSEQIITDISIGKHVGIINIVVLCIVIITFYMHIYEKYKQKKDVAGELILACFLITGILGTTFYQHNVYEHYIAYLFPVSFFVLGVSFDYLISKRFLGALIVLGYLILFVRFNYRHAQVILSSLGWTIAHTQGVAKTIEDRVKPGEKYNIVLLNDTGDIYGQNYRYFLLASEKPPVSEELFGDIDTLFIIDEQRKVEKEVDSPVYEIVTFPNKVPQEKYEIPNGPEIVVLRKTTN